MKKKPIQGEKKWLQECLCLVFLLVHLPWLRLFLDIHIPRMDRYLCHHFTFPFPLQSNWSLLFGFCVLSGFIRCQLRRLSPAVLLRSRIPPLHFKNGLNNFNKIKKRNTNNKLSLPDLLPFGIIHGRSKRCKIICGKIQPELREEMPVFTLVSE